MYVALVVGVRDWWSGSVLDVLIAARVHDILNHNRSYIVIEHKSPHAENGDRQAVCNVQYDLVFQAIADVDSCDDKARVWKNHGPPAQMEVFGTRVKNLVNLLVDSS